VIDIRDVAVFLGLDVGKGEHHATGLMADGRSVVDKPLPNSEPRCPTRPPGPTTSGRRPRASGTSRP